MTTLRVRHDGYRDAVAAIFAQPGFVRDLGVELVDCGPGWCTTRIALAPRHFQHTGVVHAGVSASMADHTAGGACLSLYAAGEVPVTVEFGIRLLRAARGTHLECRGEVVKAGRLTSAEATVHAIDGDARVLVARLSSTLFAVAA